VEREGGLKLTVSSNVPVVSESFILSVGSRRVASIEMGTK
jgi:hypothetical protein